MPDETYTSSSSTSPPSGTTFADILCRGGAGGSGSSSGGQSNTSKSGGDGGEIKARFAVDSTDTLYIRFPSGGTGGSASNSNDEEAFGGDGGDGSDVRLNDTSESARVVGAGGGGGGGAQASNDDGDSTAGGDDEQDGGDGPESATGGAAGSQSGGTGGDGATATISTEAAAGGGGGGGYNGGGGGGAAITGSLDFAEGTGGGGGDTQADGTQTLELVSESHGGQTSAEVQLTWGDSPVSSFSAVEDSGDQITLSWTNNTSPSQYEIYRDTAADVSTNQSPIATISASNTSYSDSGLLDGERYYYVMVALDSNGTAQSITSEVDATTTLPAPNNLAADAVRDSEVDISWTNNHDNGTVTVQQKPSDTSTWQDAATGLSRTTSSYTYTGLRNGEKYDLRVLAVTNHSTTEDV